MVKFSNEDNKEAMLKAFELFGFCMAAGACNNCIFYHKNLPGFNCSIGYPNSWDLFDSYTSVGEKNRNSVLKAVERKENNYVKP